MNNTATQTELRKISNTHYTIDSSTLTLVSYHLRPNEYGVWTCTCEGYNYRSTCKHVARLLLALEPTYIRIERPSAQYPEPSQVPQDEPLLEDWFTGEPHSKEAVKQARSFAKKNNIKLEDLY